MLKSYNLKLYPNKNKRERLDALLNFWKEEVNRKIAIFWEFDEVKGSYPPKEYERGGRIVNMASVKAWQIVKCAKKRRQKNMPYLRRLRLI